MIDKQLCLIASSIFILSATLSHANAQTAEQTDEILAVLETEDCEIIRDAMGEKMLSVEGTKFVAEASCADGESYTFTLDQSFKILEKKVDTN